eukprot:m.285169 g.285169  ORF g.285169 m.285169 type:complete len:202 (-) comp11313_c0_seq1:253-858(-)
MGFCNQFSALSLLVALLLAISWVFVVVGLFRPWVEGDPAGGDVEVYLFKQCFEPQGAGKGCFDINFEDINIDLWKASAVLFILGLIFLFFTFILFVVNAFTYKVLNIAKGFLSFTNLLMMVGIILVPLGFAFLDDECPAGNNEGQCGLVCNGDNDFSYFTLCDPYELGDGLIVLVTGLFLQFFASICAACLVVRHVYETTV